MPSQRSEQQIVSYKMAVKVVCALVVFLPALVVCQLSRGSECITPNEEVAKCSPLTGCRVILSGIGTRNPAAIEFAKNSQCGYDSEPLVCCGTEGLYTTISPLLPDRTKCGLTTAADRVFGGEITELEEFPWMALLKYRNDDGSDAGFKCGGTMINNRYVLTAAHCVSISTRQGFQLDSVRLGEWQISTRDDCNEGTINKECADPVVDVKIERSIVYKQYNPRNARNDIALLRLSRNVDYTKYIRPICLPRVEATTPSEGTDMFVVGWGATENSSASDIKLKAKVPFVSRSTCARKITNRGEITEQQVCAGGVSGKDSCRGDSGGPLLGKFSKKLGDKTQWYQEGIVSWGLGCGYAGYPAIYTRVSQYTQWIIDNMAP